MQFLVTNNSYVHSPEQLGEATAVLLTPVAPELTEDRLAAAMDFRASLVPVLTKWHHRNQVVEETHLDNDSATIMAPLDASQTAGACFEELVTLSQQTPWQDVWATPQAREILTQAIDSHMRTSQHLVRCKYGHEHPDDALAQNYLTQFEVHI